MPPRPLLRAALVAVALAGSLAGPARSAHAAQMGFNVAPTTGDYLTSPTVAALITKVHPPWVRLFIGWHAIEPARGVYNTALLRDYELFLKRLPAATKAIIDVEGTPPWAAGGSTNLATPPSSDQYFASFVNYLANAFRGRVAAWEIWNEEDAQSWWNGTPAQYAQLLKAAYPAIKAADPNATVITGGLEGNDYQFLAQAYAAGARGSFDAVAVHTDDACDVTAPYVFSLDPGTQTINRYYFLGFTSVHATMAANGDGAKAIFMTEIGWSSTTVTCTDGAWAGHKPAGVSPATQARFLIGAYRCLARPRYSYVKAALWFGLFDNSAAPAMNDNYGLLTAALAPKPAFDAFLNVARGADHPTGRCGNRAGPTLRVLAPRAGQHYASTLLVKVVALAHGTPIAHIELHVGARHILNFAGGRRVARGVIRWRGAGRLARGRHTITIVAAAANGTTTSMSLSVYHR